MKSWLRNLANSFSRKPEPAAETTWHAEDFQAAPDRPAVADPWAPDAASNVGRQRPARARDAAAPTQSVPADGLPPRIAPEHSLAAVEPGRAAQNDAGDMAAPAHRQDASPDAPSLRAHLSEAASSFTAPDPEAAELAVGAVRTPPLDVAETDVAPAELLRAGPSGAMAAASDVAPKEASARAERAPLEQEANLAPAPPGGEFRWRDIPQAGSLPGAEVPPSQESSETTAPDSDGAEFTPSDAPGAHQARNVPHTAGEAKFAGQHVAPPARSASLNGIGIHDRPEAPAPSADWDDFKPVDAALPSAASAGFHDDGFDLPEYDPGLSQRLGDAEWAGNVPRDSLARQRAAMIAALLDVTSRHEAETALQWLEAFFLEHRWSATFRALETAALEGLDFPTLQAMAALKDIWAETPEWWLRRIRITRANLGGTATERLPRGDTALSWRLARRICLARCDFPPEEMIDPDWLAEWHALSPNETGASFFTAFLDEKVGAMWAEALHKGLAAKAYDYEPPSLGHHRLAPRQPLPCGPGGEMVSPVMVDAIGQRQRKTEDDG